MFVILYYDVNVKRGTKVLKICRKYLDWVQNSVFEGEISEAGYEKLIVEVKRHIKEEDGDSLVVYKFRQMRYFDRVVIGEDKKGDAQFL